MDGWGDIPLRQKFIGEKCETVDTHLEEVLKPSAEGVEGEVEDGRHDEQEGWNGCVAASQNLIDTDASPLFVALLRMHHTAAAHLQDETETHIGECSTAVQSALLLHLADDMFDGLLFVLRQTECLGHQFVSFYQFACCEAYRNADSLCMILDEMHDGMQATMHSATMFCGAAEILTGRAFIVASHMDGVTHDLIYALVLHRADGNDGYAKHLLHTVDANCPTVASYLVHHVEGQHHRNAEFHELHGQVEVALYIRGIHDIDDATRMAFQNEASADNFLACIGAEAVNAWQVRNHSIWMALDDAILAVDGHTRKIPNVLFTASQLIEQCSLSAVLVADQCKSELPLLCGSPRMQRVFLMIAAFLAQAWMLKGTSPVLSR